MDKKRSSEEQKELNTNYNYKYGGDGPHQNRKLASNNLSSPLDLSPSTAIHGSMENLHHPKNYRSRGGITPGHKLKKKSHQFAPSPCVSTPQAGPSRLMMANNALVAADTKALYEYIAEERRKAVVRRAVASFTFGALRRQSNRVIELEAFQRRKNEESAARLILHNLLLNAWRNTKLELERLSTDNSQLSISVENLGLQLRVVRHLQASEKDRASEKANEIRQLKSQVAHYVQAQKNAEGEMKSLEEELRYAHEDKEKLVAQRDDLVAQLNKASEDKEVTMRKMEVERRRANRAEDELASLKLELSELRKQVRDLTAQSAHWQERAREFESMTWEMKLNLETRDQALAALKTEFELLTGERDDIRLKKNGLHEAYTEVRSQLAGSLEENIVLKTANEKASTELRIQSRKRKQLEDTLHHLQTEHREILSELYDFKLKNVRTRRAWVEAIRCVTSPSRLWAYFAGQY